MSDTQALNEALAANYLLVDFHVSAWTGKAVDEEASREVIANKGAVDGSGKFVKELLKGADEELKAVKSLGSAARAFVYDNTVPWSGARDDSAKKGARLLAATQSMSFLRDLNAIKREYDAAVTALVNAWPQRVAIACHNLAGLAKPEDYPSAAEVQSCFGIRVDLRPVPSLSDFTRVNVPTALAQALGERTAEEHKVRIANAMDDLKSRILKELNRIATQMGKAANNEPTRMHESLVTNMQGLVALVRTMNVGGNEQLNELADKIEAKLLAKPVSEVKNSVSTAARIASDAQQLAVEAALDQIWQM